MASDRNKPGVVFWLTVALVVVLAGYPLSWGPYQRLVALGAPHRPNPR
jgi:hypothetical protein